MIPSAFDYVKPASVDEALAALATEDAKILGGGQSLLPVLRLRLNAPSILVDCSGIDELRGVCEDGDTVIIGAATTHDEVMKDALVRQHVPLLAEVTSTVADRQIRHRGTLGGALAHADPRADQPAAAMALGARFSIAGPGGRHTVEAADFFLGPFETAVGPDEILVSVGFPKLGGWGSAYEKFQRTAQAWAIVGVAAAVRMDGGRIAEARIGLTNVGSTAVRASGAEAALAGASSVADVTAACAQASDGLAPFADEDADVEYRLHLARVLSARAVARAAGLA